MKLFLKYAIFFVLIAILCFSRHSAFADGGFIAGKVTRSDGKTPLYSVQIMASSEAQEGEKRHIGTVKTSTNGEYVIENLPSGTYRVWAHIDGYIDSDKSNISVATNKVTKNINFTLIKEATMSGRVTEQDGVTPVPGITVSIYGSDEMLKAATETNVEGKYEIRWIPPDKYWIRAEKDSYVMEVTLPTPISEGQKITDLDFCLEKASTMSGKIMIKNTEVPIENAEVFVVSKKKLYGYAATDADGNYLLKGLPSGPCDIAIRAIDYKLLSSEMNIPAGENITNKNFYLHPIE